MNHNFNPSPVNKAKCSTCGYDEISHTNQAVCQSCPNVGVVNAYRPLNGPEFLLCRECIEKEENTKREILAAAAAYQNPELQEKRLEEHRFNEVIRFAKKVDETVEVRTDLFNAATVSIVELKEAIEKDDSIPASEKHFALAKALKDRFEHFKQVIFDYNEKLVDINNQQKAIQVYLNQLANKLRAEEREKLKIADISYKPNVVKPVVKPVKTSKKLDKTTLRKYALELGVDEFTLQMFIVAKGVTIEKAADMLRNTMKQAVSASRPDGDDTEPTLGK